MKSYDNTPPELASPERKMSIFTSFAEEDRIEMPSGRSSTKFYKSVVRPSKLKIYYTGADEDYSNFDQVSMKSSMLANRDEAIRYTEAGQSVKSERKKDKDKVKLLDNLAFTIADYINKATKDETQSSFIPADGKKNESYIKRIKEIQKSKKRIEQENKLITKFQGLVNHYPK